MRDIPIFRAEAEVEGLANKVKACSSVAYHSPLQHMTDQESGFLKEAIVIACESTKASFGDLYPTKSVLASTSWNLNDDVFEPLETWAARNTPINKPTNVEHVEDQIVGHMTSTWALDADKNLISDTAVADDIPDYYHLCNGAVIYTHWQDEELIERTETLIASIQADEKFVSMECMFTGFDYAMKGEDGTFHIVARNEDSAFLTKHLRAYGGTGEFDGFSVGRLLRNITFSAKGYVDRPANPESIIFSDAQALDFSRASHKNPFSQKNGVLINYRQLSAAETETTTENDSMSTELDIMRAQLSKVEESNTALIKANEELTKKMAEAGVQQYETRIAELEALVEAADKDKEDKDKKAKDEKSKADELQTKVDELATANEELTTKVEETEAATVRANRISTLVDGGIIKEDAEAKVTTFASLDDEQFAVIATELIEAAKAKSGKEEEKNEEEEESSEGSDKSEASDEEKDEAEANADDKTLETVEANEKEVEGSVAADEEDTDIKETRKALAKFMSSKSRFGTKSDESEDSTE